MFISIAPSCAELVEIGLVLTNSTAVSPIGYLDSKELRATIITKEGDLGRNRRSLPCPGLPAAAQGRRIDWKRKEAVSGRGM